MQGVKECDNWIGYSIDEIRRVGKKDHRPWCKNSFPLIDLMINRAMCPGIIASAGLPMPSKSRCYMCPHQSDAEWQEVRDDPVDWPLAVQVDNEIRERDPEGGGLFLYSGRVPLELAVFSGPANGSQPCDASGCWT